MRLFVVAFKLAAATLTLSGLNTSQAIAATAPARTIAGSWQGPFLGHTFTFEFKQAGSGWTGRLQSDKSRMWDPVQSVTMQGDTVRFEIVSEPPSVYTLKMDVTGKTLTGAAQIGQHRPLPLTLTRVP